MPKLLKRIIFILIAVVIIGYAGMLILKNNTKKHSPEETITHIAKEATFTVFYNRPNKKGREIFGKLVPYNEVWRTGANEATSFTTDKDILVDGTTLKAGTYTLWTIPNPESWKVIFNSQEYGWGVSFKDGKAARDPQFDILTVEVPVQPLLNEVEQFSIYFENANDFTIMYLAWDKTAIAVPIKV
ncbi:DUF2911 domain-containing protein [Aquimarina sp. 2201CG5-10]|uniref:DUF2911 domain-containing protein n=1 Tax=Aquimarina callyspongiae TaxID=3098150 RepID=UPI002AB468DB|nr:DUF2911 domain-containing protein [Aquimarina sp. 2201CG5-10]MDY8134108.1 DUF2911 domain-containing protein [Aquimarina sp. 2201CG5-10]